MPRSRSIERSRIISQVSFILEKLIFLLKGLIFLLEASKIPDPSPSTRLNSPEKKIVRLHSIDILRGIAIFLMLMAHAETYWLQDESIWVMAIKFIIFNISGTGQFNFVAGLGLAFSWQVSNARKIPESIIVRKNLSRTIMMILVSFGYNIFATILRGTGWAGLWAWNILQCIAFSRLVGTLLLRYSKKIRLIISLSLVAITGVITFWMVPIYETDTAAKIVFYIFFNPIHGDGFLVFFPFFINGTILGEILFDSWAKQQQFLTTVPASVSAEGETKKSGKKINPVAPIVGKQIKQWLFLGLGVMIFGILVGLQMIGPEYDYYDLMGWINYHPKLYLTGMPLFLTPNSFAWAYYSGGWHIVLTCLIFYTIDLQQRSRSWFMIHDYYGRYSLTVYFGHYLILILPPIIYPGFYLDHITLWIPLFSFWLGNWAFCVFLDHKWKGKVSFEFLVQIGASKIYTQMKKRAVIPQ